jgi:hypothetical protein
MLKNQAALIELAVVADTPRGNKPTGWVLAATPDRHERKPAPHEFNAFVASIFMLGPTEGQSTTMEVTQYFGPRHRVGPCRAATSGGDADLHTLTLRVSDDGGCHWEEQ